MAGLRLGGMASGMDTDTIITQLMQIEGQSKLRLQGQQWRSEGRKQALDDVAIRLRSLKNAVDDLRSVSGWGTVQTTSSSDPSKIEATFKSGAAVGSYAIDVTQLARADQRYYNSTPSGADPKTYTIGYAGDAASNVTFTVPATATLADVAAAINGDAKSAAFASVVNDKLVLSGKKTGVDLNVTSSEITEDTALRREARPAKYKIDNGPEQSSPTNTVSGGLTGIDLNLKAITSGPVTITVGAPGPDQAALKAKVKTFVDTYNATIDILKGKLEEQPVKTPNAKSEFAKGVLRGDAGLSSVLNSLRTAMGDKVAGNPTAYDQLADIGIAVPSAQASGQVTADRLAGKLVIDDAKLTAALTSDPNAVRRLMGGVTGVDGFTQAIDKILDPVSKTSTGSLALRAEQADRETSRIKDSMTQMDARLKLKEERLRAQFTAMETALSSSQSQTSWLSGQIAGLGAG